VPELTTLPCAVCRKALERMDAAYDIPYAANIFVSYGHEGATAYDSPGGEHLELLICTDCLTMKATAIDESCMPPLRPCGKQP
jgi:hypothetical protein